MKCYDEVMPGIWDKLLGRNQDKAEVSYEEKRKKNREGLISRERQDFYEHIQEREKELLPGGEAKIVVTAAMGASIKDILLTTPLVEGSKIVCFDEGPFNGAKPVDEAARPSLEHSYRMNYARETDGSNFFRSGDLGGFAQEGLGKKDLILLELRDLGVKPDTISVTDIDPKTHVIKFIYDEWHMQLYFVEVNTHKFEEIPAELKAVIEDQKIDVVVSRGADGAFEADNFAQFTEANLAKGGLVVSDSPTTLRSESVNAVAIGYDLKVDLEGGIVFGYPVDPRADYSSAGGSPLSIKQKSH